MEKREIGAKEVLKDFKATKEIKVIREKRETKVCR
jgi:hypothetical protein